MLQIMKYKMKYLLCNQYVVYGTIFLFFLLNYNIIVGSGALLPGADMFGEQFRYATFLNNYLAVFRGAVLWFAIFLGANMIGPDSKNGNLNIFLSAYPFRTKYFIGSFIVSYGYIVFISLIMQINLLLILHIFNIPFLWSDILNWFVQHPLNILVIFSITAFASIFFKGFKSAIIGLVAYCYYNIYMFNSIPFVSTKLEMDVSQYKSMLCYLCPIQRVFGHSYTAEEVLKKYSLETIFLSIEVYQILYVVVVLIIACICFERKDLT